MFMLAIKIWVMLNAALYIAGGGACGRMTRRRNDWHVNVKLRSIVGREWEGKNKSERWVEAAEEKCCSQSLELWGGRKGGGERERAASWLLIGPAHNTPHGRANDA